MADEFVQSIRLKVDDSELVAAIRRFREAFGGGVAGIGGNNPVAGLEKGMQKASKAASDTAKKTRDIAAGMKVATKETNGLASAFDRMKGAVTGLVGAYAGFKGVSALVGFGKGSIDAFVSQRKQEQMLDTVLRNNGMGYASKYIKNQASKIQARTTIGDESMIAGAAELSTYIKDPKRLSRMMNLLADYSMGMTGGAEMNPQMLTNLATGLGKAFDGTYDSLRKKGFDTSELEMITNALKLNEDLKKGNVKTDKKTGELKLSADDKELLKWLKEHRGQNVEDLKVAALERALKDWKGLADEFAKTDEGKIQQLKNTIGDMREEIGRELLPVVANLAKEIKGNLPALKGIFDSLKDSIVSMIRAVNDHMDGIKTLASTISSFVSFIAGHISEIVAFSVTFKTVSTFAPAAASGMESIGSSIMKLVRSNAFGLVAAGIVALSVTAVEAAKKMRKAREDRRYGEAQDAIDRYSDTKARVARLKSQGKSFDPLTGRSVSEMEGSLKGLREKAGFAVADYAKNRIENGQYSGVEQGWLDKLDAKNGFDMKVGGRKVHVYGTDANGDVTGFAEWKKAEDAFRDVYEKSKEDAAMAGKGDTYNNNITVYNSISADSEMTAKIIKEQLRFFATSQLNFTSRTAAAKAFAL